MILTKRFERAVCLACDFHRTQKRKNIPSPFMSHLFSVCAMVCENIDFICKDAEEAEDYAITAILHDAIEDQGGMEAYGRISRDLGTQIADNVLMLSDSSCQPGESKPPKTERNRLYREKLKQAPPGIVLISCCDKIHNLRSMAADYLVLGDEIWKSYTLPPEQTLANYQTLEEIYKERLGSHRIVLLYREALHAVECLRQTL